MSSSPPPPKYIYKILPSPPPTPLPTSLPLSDLDARDGYIHMSTSSQVLGTLNKFFATSTSVCILRVPYERVKERVRWEIGGGGGGVWENEGVNGGFAHIYKTGEGDDAIGLRVGREEVLDWGVWEREESGWKVEGWPWGEDRP